MTEGIDYGRIMLRAFHRAVADVLGQVAEHGLPEVNKVVIKFETDHPGVDMPAHLKASYPEEMVILLDQWFDDLAVMGDRFQVTLSFSGAAETLVVPFAAIRSFSDPGVGWGLGFEGRDPDEAPLDEAERSIADEDAMSEQADGADGRLGAGDKSTQGDPESDPDGDPDGTPDGSGGNSTVVSLDSFRRG